MLLYKRPNENIVKTTLAEKLIKYLLQLFFIHLDWSKNVYTKSFIIMEVQFQF